MRDHDDVGNLKSDAKRHFSNMSCES
jgi:hypothetical protein